MISNMMIRKKNYNNTNNKDSKREWKKERRKKHIELIDLIHLPGKGLGRFLHWPVFELCRISGRILVYGRWYRQRLRQYVLSMIAAEYRYPLTWPIRIKNIVEKQNKNKNLSVNLHTTRS